MRLFDAFCCAGGATKGYQRAGFYVVGADINPQPRYCGDEFIQGDAIELLSDTDFVASFDAIHASPPCQAYSAMTKCRPGLADEYPDLIAWVRALLDRSGLPYVIENVPGAPLRRDLMLCGQMFGLMLYRHRLFESNIPLIQPDHPKHVIRGGRAGHWKPGQIVSVSGTCAPVALAREAMGIDWTNRKELSEAIPPAYTEHIGAVVAAHITTTAEDVA